MKKTILLTAILSIFILSVRAQDNSTTTSTTTPPVEKPKPNIWFGPRFGLDLSHFTYDINEITGQLGNNYQAGIFCQIGKTFYIQPEVYYASYNIDLKVPGVASNSGTNYIKVPIMVGVKILDIGLVALRIDGGPQFSFKLDNTDKLTGEKNLSWQLGAGVDVLGFIVADLRYNIQPGQSISTQVQNFNLNTTGLNLTVGLKFR